MPGDVKVDTRPTTNKGVGVMKKQIRRLNALVWGLLGLFIVAMPVTSWAQSSQVV
jgi:hypothetical protein